MTYVAMWPVQAVTPELARAWLRVARDVLIYMMATVILGTSLALYVIRDEPPNYTYIAAALFLYGLAPALRADEWLFRNGKNGNGKKDAENGPGR